MESQQQVPPGIVAFVWNTGSTLILRFSGKEDYEIWARHFLNHNHPIHTILEGGHEWLASVCNRASGTRCPKCTLWQTSMEEIRLRCELRAVGFPVDEVHNVKLREEKYARHCDIVCSEWSLIVEFDGHYFHRSMAATNRDTAKTLKLVNEGWIVIRVRDGLSSLFNNDVCLPLGKDSVTRCKAVVRKAVELGFRPLHSNEYLNSNHPWGEEDAEMAILKSRWHYGKK